MSAKKISADKQHERRACTEGASDTSLSFGESGDGNLLLYHDFFVYTDAIKIETENILRKNGNEVKKAEKRVERRENKNAMVDDIVSILISKGIITQKHARYARDFISERLA